MATAKTLTLFLLSLSFFFNFSHQATTISVSSKTLTKSSHTIKIEWSNILDPSPLDWLGIYSPSSSLDDEFIGYIFLNTSIGYQSGSGSIWLPLTNTRSDYQFRIFRWTEDEIDPRRQDRDQNPLPHTKHKLAVSVKVGFGEERLGPDQVHLAFTNYVDEIRVMFVMGDGSPGWVRYGKDIKKLNVQVETKISRYEKDDMCDFPANSSFGWRDPGWVHDGVMKELESGKKYFYQVGSDLRGWSPIYNFISRDNNANETFAILFGDMGTDVAYTTFYRAQPESTSTVKWILRDIENLGNKPVFVSHIGDISYARGCSWLWDEFFTQIEPIASKVPYHVCIGNHEYDWPSQPWKPSWAHYVYNKDGGGECGVPYSIKFRMPGNSSFPTGTSAPDTRNLYYSFNAGVVHFLYVSTETNFLKGSDQYDFIKTDLRKVNRRKTPFIVVQGHRPMYTTSSGEKDIPLRKKLLEHLEPIFVENNVTLALWGHVHRYERFCPMNNFTCTVLSSNFTGVGGSPVHVVIGMGGQDWQKSWEPRDNHRNLPIYPQPSRSMYRGGEFGYTRLFATREKLVLSYVGNHDGEVHDFVEISSGLSDNIMVDKHSNFDDLSNIDVKISKYVMGSCILVLEVFLGYLFVIRCGKGCVQRDTWLPIMSEDV